MIRTIQSAEPAQTAPWALMSAQRLGSPLRPKHFQTGHSAYRHSAVRIEYPMWVILLALSVTQGSRVARNDGWLASVEFMQRGYCENAADFHARWGSG